MYIPKMLHLQWHITERCNLRCKHCYQGSYDKKELSFKELMTVLKQYKDALSSLKIISGKDLPGHITVTGGEPLSREDFFEFLSEISKNKEHFGFSILTNGTMIDETSAKKLKDLGPKYIQVSIEGTKETHDSIRGKGSYDKAVNGLKHLVKAGHYTLISFTAHKKNYKEFRSVAELGRKLGVSRVWSDRLIPSGCGEQMKEMMLSPEETKEFFQIMKEEQLKRSPDYHPNTEIAMHRALQFLCGGTNYSCQAGKNLITIDVNGDVYPCRRMPIKVGNVLSRDLFDIYNESELLQRLRNEKSTCSACIYYKKCQGGLRCLSNALTGNPLEKDPGCWIEHQDNHQKNC